MKTILVVWNKAARGKTESIREFANLLLNTYPDYTPALIKIKPKRDFSVIVEINGKTIGIISQGDPKTGLSDKLLKLSKKGCDIIVCATRTSGETVHAVINVAKGNEYDVIWTATYETEDKTRQAFVNNLKGKHMLDLLQSLSRI